MDYLVTIYRKNNDELLCEAKSTEKGVVEFLKRFTNLSGFDQATFMHELRETGASSVLEENTLPYEVVASKL